MARKITTQLIRAFLDGDTFRKSNTEVIYNEHEETSYLYLFDNLIAKLDHYKKELTITNAGWKSNTTKERLNGLPNVSITQKNYEWYLNGQLWNGEPVTIEL